jgi:hypothetical protein
MKTKFAYHVECVARAQHRTDQNIEMIDSYILEVVKSGHPLFGDLIAALKELKRLTAESREDNSGDLSTF